MAITTDITTLPGQTIVTDSNGGIAIDYSAYYARIATALEAIANSLNVGSTPLVEVMSNIQTSSEAIANSLNVGSTPLVEVMSNIQHDISSIKTLAEGPGITTSDPLAWMGLMSVYKLYVEDPGAIGIDELKAYKAKIDALVASLE